MGEDEIIARASLLIAEADDQPKAAAILLAVAVDALSKIGGSEATAAILLGNLRRIHAGRAPESLHAPGHA